jgi:hypothetical protein
MKNSWSHELKQVWQWLWQFVRQPEIPGMFWLSWFAYMAILIGINYSLDFENEVLDQLTPQPIMHLAYGLFYLLAMVGTLLLQRIYYLKFNVTRPLALAVFWLLLVKVLNGNLDIYSHWVESSLPLELQYWARKCLSNASRAGIAIFGAVISVWLFPKEQTLNFFGLFSTGKSLKPYWLMLGLMVPLLVAASFQADFQAFYPRYKDTSAAHYLQVPQWLTTLAYELCYGLDFVAVELLFRGMMIWILGRYLGIHAVFPMVTIYCMIHFGKPLGETISSIFGGTILGVIAFHSRSIMGGVFIHLGIAWLMELVAGVQHAFR